MPDKKNLAQKIAVIGAGAVGSAVAYTDMVKNLASEVLLIDLNEKKEKGEVMDISDGLSFVETGSVKGANFKDAANADIIVVTAGLAQKPGETRMDLVKKNREVTKSIFKSIGKIKPSAIVIMISNPVDVLTHIAQQVSGLPKSQVFGTGTALDTARLRHAVASRLKVNAQSVDGFILGEHGDSEFAAWSTVTVGGAPVTNFISAKELAKIAEKVKKEAYEIINRKGATFYGIALTVADIIEAVLYDQNKILPLSTRLNGWNGVSGVCLGVPAVLGRKGIVKIWPLKLSASEQKKFQKSATTTKKYLK